MEESARRTIEDIIGQMQCPKDFKCAQSGFENLCRAQDIRLDKYLQCLENRPYQCKFGVSLGAAYLCHCPLRVYLAKALKK
jgi:hypothetical protein